MKEKKSVRGTFPAIALVASVLVCSIILGCTMISNETFYSISQNDAVIAWTKVGSKCPVDIRQVELPEGENPLGPKFTQTSDTPTAYLGSNKKIPLYKNPTSSTGGVEITVEPYYKAKWGDAYDISKLSNWAATMYDKAAVTNPIIGNVKDNITKIGAQVKDKEVVDKDGRILIAGGGAMVGLKNHDLTGFTADEMKYGTKVDIELIRRSVNEDGGLNITPGTKVYLRCTLADCKAHTYVGPGSEYNWLIQTGFAGKDGKLYYTKSGTKDNFSTVYKSTTPSASDLQDYNSNGVVEFIWCNAAEDYTYDDGWAINKVIVY